MSNRPDSDIDPSLSIIIPFRDNPEELFGLLRTILNQKGISDAEIICIDNGSEIPMEQPPDLSSVDRIVMIREENYPGSPYSARNRGIENAKGGVVIFIDANSLPEPDWLISGIRCMQEKSADMVAGRVGFDIGPKSNGAELADALSSIRMEEAVKERGAAYTANLFVKKELFDRFGLFKEGIRSGGDVAWTNEATRNGSKLVYCPDSVVIKKARGASAFYKKKIRTGRGYYYNWLNQEPRVSWAYNLLRSFKPRLPKEPDLATGKKLRAGFHLWAAGIVTQCAFIYEMMRGKER
ncbi:MAG: glycosyltransferase [Balneolaceae bacterium]|nr:glycosyltransferase [Balneolaceae bacterium]MCH8549888.1 glycosyltransferase [Balneolaceae bacterium]